MAWRCRPLWPGLGLADSQHTLTKLTRCKSAAPASVPEPGRQWFCSKAERVVTYADRALAILDYNRNDEFHSTVSGVLRVANTTPASSTAKVDLKAHAVRQVAEVMSAASMRHRAFIGAPSCVPFPAFTNAADKATAMQTQAKAARYLVTSIGVVTPSMLHGAAAATDNDDDDDDGSGGGRPSKKAKKKAAQVHSDAQQANRDAMKANGGGGGNGGGKVGGGGRGSGSGGGGGGGAPGTPGDLAWRVKVNPPGSVAFHFPKLTGANLRAETDKTFDVGAIKNELTAAGANVRKMCVPFQFMYAMSTSFTDDDRRLVHAHRFCGQHTHADHNSVTAVAHEPVSGLDRALLLRHES